MRLGCNACAPDAAAYLNIPIVGTIEEAFAGSDIVVIANNHPVFRALDLGGAAETMNRPGILYDFWNMHSGLDTLPTDIVYLGLGAEHPHRPSA